MAACHPKVKTHPGAELFLWRFAEAEWGAVVRPWLEAGAGRLERAFLVAPTRGHSQALKQRCVTEGLPLLGVEFLTPGLARRKRRPGLPLAHGLQVLILQGEIEQRLAGLGPDDPARGLWKSLASDIESALGDFGDLLRSGLGASDFPQLELREVFGLLESATERYHYVLDSRVDRAAATASEPGSAIAERLLILAGGPENWGEYFGLAALARRCASVTVALAEPEFAGRGVFGEEWVGLWERTLGVDAVPVDYPEPEPTCASVADLWNGEGGSAEGAQVIAAASRSDEMARVADALGRLLDRGGETVAVIFPWAGSAHARLARLLDERAIPFTDLIGVAGTPPVETLLQRALVDFYERGCRLEELLALWPLLRSLGHARCTPAEARQAGQELFDETQAHGLEAQLARLQGSDRIFWRELGRVAALLLPGWPERLTPADAVARFEAVRDSFFLGEPSGWSVLRVFAQRAQVTMPARALLGAIRGFLPEKGPASAARGPGEFARVTLTTVRRAAGLAWSDVVFVESNAGVWPERREPSPWLGDEARRRLNLADGSPRGLATADDRAAIERRLFCAIARDTRRSVTLSAALFSEEEPEVRLGPNTLLERVMWSQSLRTGGGASGTALERLALAPPRPSAVDRQAAPPEGWHAIWEQRRDPARPFDEHFLSDPSGRSTPSSLPASQVERGIKDPARLWFDSVLRVRRVEWRPFVRDRRKAVGTAVHRALAVALRGAPAEGQFFVLPERAVAEASLAAELGRQRTQWPQDRYWDSFHLDVGSGAREMLRRVFQIAHARFGAVECRLPEGATIPVGRAGRLGVQGRVDFVLADRPGWSGAEVDIVDFKTGGGSAFSSRRMGSTGEALQLGVYLLAAQSAGASGRVWMFKPDAAPRAMDGAAVASSAGKLDVLGAHLATGIFGALTPDRDEYTRVFEWPLACAPIGYTTLEGKFEATFGAPAGEGEAEADDD
jgi:hypothetical protein